MARHALLILGKDLRQRLRDRSALLVAIVVPLALAAIFSLVLRDVGDKSVTFEYALVDQDRGAAEQTFAHDVLERLAQRGAIDLRRAASLDEGRRLADDGKVAATFIVPHGFSAAVAAGKPARLEVIGDIDAPIGTLVARSIVESFTAELASVRAAVASVLRAPGGASRSAAEVARRAARVPDPVRIDDVSATKKELEPTTFYAAGMAVFFLFFTVQLGVSSLLDERREGTLARLLAAPIPRASILAGKVLTSVVVGVASMTVLAFATTLLLGAHWGNPIGVGLLIVCGVLAATAVTALTATLARTPEQAGYWQSIVALVLGMLGGSFFPVSHAGGLLAKLSLLTPHAWFLRGLADLSGGSSPTSVLGAAAAILAFAAVTGSVAVLRLGRLAAT